MGVARVEILGWSSYIQRLVLYTCCHQRRSWFRGPDVRFGPTQLVNLTCQCH